MRTLARGVALIAAFGAAESLHAVPELAGPGAKQNFAATTGRCPAFTWHDTAAADSFELAVYGVPDDIKGFDPEHWTPLVNLTVSGSTRQWIPTDSDCFEAGRRYAWTVRALQKGGASEWSDVHFFQVNAAAKSAAQFGVDSAGNVTAASFTGNGSGLTGLPCPKPAVESALTCSADLVGKSLDGSLASFVGGSCETGDCYSCGSPVAGLAQANAEHVYSFQCQVTGDVTVNLTNQNCDIDLYTLQVEGDFQACRSFPACLAGDTTTSTSTSQVTFSCTAGQVYHLIVEHTENSQAICTYDLAIDVGSGTGCPEDCDDGLDNDADSDIDCSDSDCFSDPACAI